MKAKLIKTKDGYHLNDLESGWWIGDTDHEKVKAHKGEQILSKLSIKNCQAIERGYDLDKLIEEVYPTPIFGLSIERKRERASFKEGFQKALEILGDKRFTEEDMRCAWEYGNSLGMTGGAVSGDFENYLHREYPQYYEWDVEIVMECTQCQSYGYVSECRDNCNKKFLQPKLDADGCIILKRV